MASPSKSITSSDAQKSFDLMKDLGRGEMMRADSRHTASMVRWKT